MTLKLPLDSYRHLNDLTVPPLSSLDIRLHTYEVQYLYAGRVSAISPSGAGKLYQDSFPPSQKETERPAERDFQPLSATPILFLLGCLALALVAEWDQRDKLYGIPWLLGLLGQVSQACQTPSFRVRSFVVKYRPLASHSSE